MAAFQPAADEAELNASYSSSALFPLRLAALYRPDFRLHHGMALKFILRPPDGAFVCPLAIGLVSSDGLPSAAPKAQTRRCARPSLPSEHFRS